MANDNLPPGWSAVGEHDDQGPLARRRKADAIVGDPHHDDVMRSMRRLVNGMANDFNNLLSVVLGSLETLIRRTDPTEEQLRYITDAAAGARRASVLTRHMLAFGNTAGEPQSKPAAEIIRTVGTLVQTSLAVRIETDADLPPDMIAYCDPKELEIALLNLAVNARDASPPGSTIRLQGRDVTLADGEVAGLAAGRYVKIAVIDCGRGMDDAAPGRVSEPHSASEPDRKSAGLATVRAIMTRAGGTFQIASAPAGVTRAELLVPGGPCRRLRHAEAVAEQVARKRKLTVLIADGDDLARSTFCAMVEDLGHRVFDAACAAQALDVLATLPRCDVLLTDLALPGMSGADLAAEVAQGRPSVRAIVTTGGGAPAALPASIVQLRKPFEQSTLKALLDKMSVDLPNVNEPAGVISFRRD